MMTKALIPGDVGATETFEVPSQREERQTTPADTRTRGPTTDGSALAGTVRRTAVRATDFLDDFPTLTLCG